MTLQQIRDAQTLAAIKPAIKFLCENMQKMTFGEFSAYKNTLQDRAVKVGSSLKELNDLAVEYQDSGELK